MNQGEWELLGVLPQFQEFSIESSDSYAEMKFYVSGTHPGRRQGAHGEEAPWPFPSAGGVPCSLNEAVGETQLRCPLTFPARPRAWIQRQYMGFVYIFQQSRLKASCSKRLWDGEGSSWAQNLSAPTPPSSSLDPRSSSADGPSSMRSACFCPVSSLWSWTSWASTCLRTVAREFPSRSRSSWAIQSS